MEIRCPECHFEAVNKYGTIQGGKQRYICLACDRQFVFNPDKKRFRNRPKCPTCGKPMHSYMKGSDYVRFRFSDFPNCRTYEKISNVEFEIPSFGLVSKDFNMTRFINAVEGKPVWETFHLAHEELTTVERLLIKNNSKIAENTKLKIRSYIHVLTGFIIFLRSTIKFPKSSKKSDPLYWQYWESINQR